jgi:hypothetical protein
LNYAWRDAAKAAAARKDCRSAVALRPVPWLTRQASEYYSENNRLIVELR